MFALPWQLCVCVDMLSFAHALQMREGREEGVNYRETKDSYIMKTGREKYFIIYASSNSLFSMYNKYYKVSHSQNHLQKVAN